MILKNMKKILLLLAALLPCAAFADIPITSFFTPPATDYSMTTLNTIFGAMGNVLQGRGNQLLGITMGIFNACWIIAIGIGVLFVIWDAVIHAAQSGEMIIGKTKKTVFKVIGIVIGFALAIPSGTTGYSLAQSGAMWMVVQGVGLADRISGQMYTYFQAGGVVFNTQPATGAEMTPLMTPASTILKSQICMFSLESILDKDQAAQDDALQTVEDSLGTNLPSTGYDTKPKPVGYSVNSDNTITVGTYADDETFNETGHRYNNECGTISWSYDQNTFVQRTGGTQFTAEEAQAEKEQVLSYISQATQQMFNSLEPVARQIASIDPEAEDSETQFYNLADSAGMALANSGVGFSTILDPARRKSQMAAKDSLATSMAQYNAKGWVFTPFLTTIPGLYSGQSINISNYSPSVVEPDVSKLTQISDEDKAKIAAQINHVNADDYVGKSLQYLDLYDQGNYWGADFSFDNLIDDLAKSDDGYAANDVNKVTNYLNEMMFIQRNTLEFASTFVPEMIGYGGYGLFYGLGEAVGFFDKDAGNNLKDIANNMKDLGESIGGAIEYALDTLNNLVSGVKQDLPMAVKGGMNNDLMELTKQIGPVGPVLATMLTAMIGKSIESLSTNAFTVNKETGVPQNAMVTSITIGGDMMVASLEATFAAGKVMFISTILSTTVSGLAEMVPNAVIGGGLKMFGSATQFANKGIDAIVPLYIMLALFFFAGGLLLYILVPLSWILLFGAVVLRWIGMVLINILAAPVFCFNLIRSDGDGLIGKGERYLVDLLRTVITPALLTLGAVVFVVLFNLAFQMVALILTNFLPLLFKVYDHPYLVSISLAAILMVFGLVMVYLTEVIGTICTSELVQAVGSAIGEALHQVQGAHGLHDQLKQGVGQVGGQFSNPAKQVSESGGGIKK